MKPSEASVEPAEGAAGESRGVAETAGGEIATRSFQACVVHTRQDVRHDVVVAGVHDVRFFDVHLRVVVAFRDRRTGRDAKTFSLREPVFHPGELAVEVNAFWRHQVANEHEAGGNAGEGGGGHVGVVPK